MPVTSALIIEPRNHVTLDWVIDNVSNTLPDVPIHFHHGLKNEKLAQAISRVYPKVQLHNMGVENLSIGEYSNYMTQSSLYENLPEGHTIVFQTDSAFCNPEAEDNVERLNELCEYDYVGAPWKFWTNQGVGGNGGFSLRNTKTMTRLGQILEERTSATDIECENPSERTNCTAEGSSNPDKSCVTTCRKIAAKKRHPEDLKISKLCQNDPDCALPTLLEAAEFQNQHEDFTAATTDSEVVKEPVSGRRCLKTKRLDTIGFHKPEKVCHRLQACPSLENFPWRKRGKMTDSEVQMKIAELEKNIFEK